MSVQISTAESLYQKIKELESRLARYEGGVNTKDENGCMPCPFCGGKCDPEGWLGGDGESGPECETCGATTTTVNTWNARI